MDRDPTNLTVKALMSWCSKEKKTETHTHLEKGNR